ncbi:Hypothetical protein HVIM_03993 [Roseomonas mucosa]|nr:Hypothetical protein HVIM_03993 [Roseomonas mucosa]QDD98471.1 Hypothetical protein ADP8_03993 [Roseomonas mucosa]
MGLTATARSQLIGSRARSVLVERGSGARGNASPPGAGGNEPRGFPAAVIAR